jgi:predicted esterase
VITETLETSIHGRYLHEARGSDRLLVGFHGYGELAEASFHQMERIPGIERWSVAAIQALHPFYTRTGDVVASWMTSLDRTHAIADNLNWVRNVLAALPEPRLLVFAGFSQGAAMAARAAADTASPAGLILLGGDIPPEIKSDPEVVLPPVLLGRGTQDTWYTETKFKEDLKYLERSTRVVSSVFAGGHEWSEEFRRAAGEFLHTLE